MQDFQVGMGCEKRIRKDLCSAEGLDISSTMNFPYRFWIRTLPTKIVTTARQSDNSPISEVTCFKTWNDEDRIPKMSRDPAEVRESFGTEGNLDTLL